MSTPILEVTKPVYTVPGMCELFGCSRGRIYTMVQQGLLPAPIHIGRRVFWLKESLELAIANMRRRSEKNLRK